MQETDFKSSAVDWVRRRGCLREGAGWRRMLRFWRLGWRDIAFSMRMRFRE